MRNIRNGLMAAALCVTGITAQAQGTVEDYNRAYALGKKFAPEMVLHSGVEPHWIGGTGEFWYKTRTADGEVYVRINPEKGSRTEQKDTTGLHIVEHRTPSYDGSDGHYWSETDDERSGGPVVSPDGKSEAFIYGHNVCVKDLATGNRRVLSMDGCEGDYYSCRLQWSPDSRMIAVCKIKAAPKHYIYYVESCPPDQFQPKLHKQEYAKPGDELPQKTPVIFDVATGRQLMADITQLPCQYGIEDMRWNEDGSGITFEYNRRGHQVYRLCAMSAADGKLTTIVEEASPKYVNWTRLWRHHFADGRRMLWTSERDNHNHLYLYDKKEGKLLCQVTRGEWYVREILHVDEEDGTVYFSANGMNKGEDPYFIHYYKVGIDGKGLKELTPEKAMHRAWMSPDSRYMVDVYSTVADAPVAVLRSAADGRVLMTLERADISALVTNGWKAPEVFTAKGRDGKTDMWGIIIRPTNFDPQKTYPVIEYIYSGPGSQYVPKSFYPNNHFMTPLAELGFIVVMVDGMTTSFRSKAFEEVCYKNLKDAGLPDHIPWIKAAARKYPQMDIDRVGIFGCSAGGQEAMNAVIMHPEFYKAAYAACGCHDNRMDKIWWNEQWMGYPVDSSYVECSNIENARKLSRPLMLCWGELDDNVDPASSMKVVDALMKANKDFEMIVVPGAHHTMGESWGDHKRYDFFVRHLMKQEPPAWERIEY